jgi:hypothetical protein
MATVALKKAVKCRHISECSVIAYWGIFTLALTIRFKTGFVKGYDTIGIFIDAFYGGMDSGNAGTLTRDKTNRLLSVSHCEKTRPTIPSGWTIVDHDFGKSVAFECENDILVFHFVGPSALGKLLWRPAFDKFKKCFEALVLCVRKIAQMPISESF